MTKLAHVVLLCAGMIFLAGAILNAYLAYERIAALERGPGGGGPKP